MSRAAKPEKMCLLETYWSYLINFVIFRARYGETHDAMVSSAIAFCIGHRHTPLPCQGSYNSKISNGRKIARIAPISIIFWQNRSQRRLLSFSKFLDRRFANGLENFTKNFRNVYEKFARSFENFRNLFSMFLKNWCYLLGNDVTCMRWDLLVRQRLTRRLTPHFKLTDVRDT